MPEQRIRIKAKAKSTSNSIRWHSAVDYLIDGVMTALLIFCPLALGGVNDWAQLVIMCLTWTMGILFFAKHALHRREHIVITGVYVIIALYVLLLVAQIVPMSPQWVDMLSPRAASIRAMGFPKDAGIPNTTLSLAPFYTWQVLRLMIAYAIVFIVALNTYREGWQIRKILGVIAIAGGLAASVGLLQRLFGLHSVYGMNESPDNDQIITAGTFSNRNNFGVHLLLALGATLALIGNYYGKAAKSYHLKNVMQFRRMPAADRQVLLAYLINAFVLVVCIVQTGSRGALLASVLSALIVSGFLSRRFKGNDVFGVVLFTLILGLCVAFSVAGDILVPRFMEFADTATPQMRVVIAKDLWNVFCRFPIIGIGHGAMAFIYPIYQTLQTPLTVVHADNDFAEQLAETGVVGIVLILALMAIVGRAMFRCLRRLHGAIKLLPYGLFFGLLAAVIATATTWGMHVPANAIVVAVYAAMIVRLSLAENSAMEITESSSSSSHSHSHSHSHEHAASTPTQSVTSSGAGSTPPAAEATSGEVTEATEGHHGTHSHSHSSGGHDSGSWHGVRRVLALGMLILLVGVAVPMLPDAINGAVAETYAHSAEIINTGISNTPPGSLDDFRLLLAKREMAAKLQPNRVDYRYLLNFSRWQSVVANAQLQSRTQLNAQEKKLALKIADDFEAFRRIYPTHGLSAAFEGQLRWIGGQPKRGLALADFTSKSWPFLVHAQFISGIVFAEANKIPESLSCFRQAIKVDDAHYRRAIADYLMNVNRPDLAISIAQDDPDFMWWVVARYRTDPARVQMVEDADAKLEAMLEEKVSGDATAEEYANLAWLKAKKFKYDQAADLYNQAIKMNYTNASWHYARAIALRELGRTNEAIEEVRSCIRQNPSRTDYRELLSELTLMTPGQPKTETRPSDSKVKPKSNINIDEIMAQEKSQATTMPK